MRDLLMEHTDPFRSSWSLAIMMPVFYRRLLALQSGQPSEPKEAGPEVGIGGEVIETLACWGVPELKRSPISWRAAR